jgi:hypothetical protein
MSNREKNVKYDNDKLLEMRYRPKYDFSEIDTALRMMAALSGHEKDQNSYQKMKENCQ